MLGHLKPRFCQLTSPSKQHYQHLYCSICYSLRLQFGLSASFFINHELTLSLAAFPDYVTMNTENCACPAKLFCKQKPILLDPLIDKAASLCLLLVWLKLVDSETDSPAFYKKILRQSIEAKVQPVLANLTPSTRQFIDSYLLLIRANSTDFSTTSKMSGLLAKQIFQELCQHNDNTQETVTEITLLLGELITVADALLDLNKDIERKQYNPIITATEQNNSTLMQEYTLLKIDYDKLVQDITAIIHATNLKSVNPLFCEILQQSLNNLSGNIHRANTIMFADSARNRRNNSASNQQVNNNGCAEGCGGCFDCCQFCGENGNCCECGSCDGCGGCCECGSFDCG
jgi:hypothetical protein